jgi:hypothetical protein
MKLGSEKQSFVITVELKLIPGNIQVGEISIFYTIIDSSN